MIHLHRALAAGVVASLAACSGGLRNVEAYRADTTKLLATRSAQLQRCYSDALRADGKAAGTVTVQFVIEKDTGAISRPTVEPAHSTAPPALGRCVVKAIDGLVLAPPDGKEARATFVYAFQPAPPPEPRTWPVRPACDVPHGRGAQGLRGGADHLARAGRPRVGDPSAASAGN